METLLINEMLVSQFKFWRDDQVQTGMRFRNKLFRYVCSFDLQQRQQAFALSYSLAQQGPEVIMTVARSQYTVWVSLHGSQGSAAPLHQSSPQWHRIESDRRVPSSVEPGKQTHPEVVQSETDIG